LSITRRSSSVLPIHGSSARMPMSQPSVTAKAISRMPISAHQMTFNVS
jgi:hypothetical protein